MGKAPAPPLRMGSLASPFQLMSSDNGGMDLFGDACANTQMYVMSLNKGDELLGGGGGSSDPAYDMFYDGDNVKMAVEIITAQTKPQGAVGAGQPNPLAGLEPTKYAYVRPPVEEQEGSSPRGKAFVQFEPDEPTAWRVWLETNPYPSIQGHEFTLAQPAQGGDGNGNQKRQNAPACSRSQSSKSSSSSGSKSGTSTDTKSNSKSTGTRSGTTATKTASSGSNSRSTITSGPTRTTSASKSSSTSSKITDPLCYPFQVNLLPFFARITVTDATTGSRRRANRSA